MEIDRECDDFIALGATIEEAKKRCEAVMGTVETLCLSQSCKHTLLKLIQSELSFLSRFSSNDFTPHSEPSICVNIGHLEAVVHILQQPNIFGVSRVCKTIPAPPSIRNGHHSKGAHVDIVCTFERNPVWFIVSDRNPKYILWYESSKNKGLQGRVQLLINVARHSVSLKPTSIIFFFSNGLDQLTHEKFRCEFGAVDLRSKFSDFDFSFLEVGGDWIVVSRSYQQASVVEINVDFPENVNISKDSLGGSLVKAGDVNLSGSFGYLVSDMVLRNNGGLVNFDTTALIAIVSGISNGNTQKILDTPEGELKGRFKGNYKFVIGQVMSEIENPIHTDFRDIISRKKCIVCESVCSEFNELVSMCGGPNEKRRAGHLLKCLVVVPDCPSARMTSLPTTRKLALKNKTVFGTGDYWRAPTLTANMGFVRAVLQMGMSLFTIEHRPRALTGD